MAKHSLPESFKSGFNIIGGFDGKALKLICESLEKASLGEEPEDIANKNQDLLSYSRQELVDVYTTIFSLINYLNEIDKYDPIVIEDIIESFDEIHELNPEVKQNLKENLKKIIFLDSPILQTIKGFNLLSDGDKVFMKSKIISDVRLIFDSEISKKTRGAVLVHQLKITYRENGEWNDIFISLDSNDLNNLNESILRAFEKEKLILSNVFTRDLTFIQPKKS